MTIADVIQRGNPEEGEENWNDDGIVSLPNTPEILEKKPAKNVIIILILLLSATASFGLGYLAGRQGSQAGGLLVGSGSSNSSTTTLDSSALNLGNP